MLDEQTLVEQVVPVTIENLHREYPNGIEHQWLGEAPLLSPEPSGTDFLSPALAEADLLRRILPQSQFVDWLWGFSDASPGR